MKQSIKYQLITLIVLTLATIKIKLIDASATCLYCKRMDTMASFLYSYSYCKDTNECLPDQWNYYNKWCSSGWKRGWKLNVDDDCESLNSVGVCPQFTSNEYYFSKFVNNTNRRLEPNAKCSVYIDATSAVGRVIFKDTSMSLGVLKNGYELGETITVEQGDKQEITIYNGGRNGGYLRFELIFSAAIKPIYVSIVTFTMAAMFSFS